MSENPKKYKNKWDSFASLILRPAIVLVLFVAFAVYAAVTPHVPFVILIIGWGLLIPLGSLQVYVLMRLFSVWKNVQLLENITDHKADTEKATEKLLSEAKQKPENYTELADALYARSVFLFTTGNYKDSLNPAHERVELLRDSHDIDRLGPALTWLAEVCASTGDMELAQRHISLALNLLKPTFKESATATTCYAGALRCQGSLLNQLHKYEAAAASFSQALSHMQTIEAPEQVLMPFMVALGAAYVKLNQLESAQEMLGEALRIAEKHESKDSKLLASVYTRVGKMYTKMGNLDLGESYCTRAVSILEAIPESQRGGDGAYYGNLGLVRLKQGRLPEAEQLLKKAIQSLKERCGVQHPKLVEIQETLHDVFVAQNRLNESEEIAREKDAIIALHKMG